MVIPAGPRLHMWARLFAGSRPFSLGQFEQVLESPLDALAQQVDVGNRVANVHAQLPIDESNPRQLFQMMRSQLNELKDSHEVDATGLLMHIGDYLPRLLADRIARAVFHRQRIVETVITNVPGPRASLFLGPHRMIDAYPVAPIGGLVRTTVAIWSYADRLAVGISADRHSVPDIDLLSEGIQRGFENLLELA
ncbi:MAG: WS/DGAT domain-containing protein [Actinomycetota bacterium]